MENKDITATSGMPKGAEKPNVVNAKIREPKYLEPLQPPYRLAKALLRVASDEKATIGDFNAACEIAKMNLGKDCDASVICFDCSR